MSGRTIGRGGLGVMPSVVATEATEAAAGPALFHVHADSSSAAAGAEPNSESSSVNIHSEVFRLYPSILNVTSELGLKTKEMIENQRYHDAMGMLFRLSIGEKRSIIIGLIKSLISTGKHYEAGGVLLNDDRSPFALSAKEKHDVTVAVIRELIAAGEHKHALHRLGGLSRNLSAEEKHDFELEIIKGMISTSSDLDEDLLECLYYHNELSTEEKRGFAVAVIRELTAAAGKHESTEDFPEYLVSIEIWLGTFRKLV